MGIYQQSGSTLINLSKAVHNKLKGIKEKFPEDIDIKVTSDQSDFIKESLANLYSNGIQGILLYFFMKSFMASTIINIAIPVALCSTTSLMYFGDISLNTMSLRGLIVGIGMVIDNSNIVLENILMSFHKLKNVAKKGAIYEATKSLIATIMSSTLTSVAIFIPFVFVAGMIGQLFKQLALTITYSLMSSIFAALFLVPCLCLTADLSKQSITAGMDTINKYFALIFKKVLDYSMSKVTLIVLIYYSCRCSMFYVSAKGFYA